MYSSYWTSLASPRAREARRGGHLVDGHDVGERRRGFDRYSIIPCMATPQIFRGFHGFSAARLASAPAYRALAIIRRSCRARPLLNRICTTSHRYSMLGPTEFRDLVSGRRRVPARRRCAACCERPKCRTRWPSAGGIAVTIVVTPSCIASACRSSASAISRSAAPAKRRW